MLKRPQCHRFSHNPPLDRLIALVASDSRGEIITKPFQLEGSLLTVNIEARGGEFCAEVLGLEGVPIDGFTHDESIQYTGVNELRLQPRWKQFSNLKTLQGRIVQLKFYLRKAKLYTFQILSEG